MSSVEVLGKFLWHELLTTDPGASAGFYSKVLGWNTQLSEGAADYTMLANAAGPVAGVRPVGQDPVADKAGPNWLTYVGVPDLLAALVAVEAGAGRVVHPVTEVPGGGGRYAVIADPQGGIIGLYEPAAGVSGGGSAPVWQWHELTAEDPEAALRFYKTIFGWDVIGTHAMGGDVGTYYLFGVGTTQMGGAYRRPAHLPPGWPRWLVYLAAPGVVAAAEAAKAAGGKLLNGPHQVPGGNWIAQVADPNGVPVALHGPKEAAAAAPKAPARVKTKAVAKPAPKAKAKVKAKPKAKAKSKTKAKTKARPKVKAKVKTKAKARSKAKPKTKGKSKAKVKTKAKAKPRKKARKAPRRGK